MEDGKGNLSYHKGNCKCIKGALIEAFQLLYWYLYRCMVYKIICFNESIAWEQNANQTFFCVCVSEVIA